MKPEKPSPDNHIWLRRLPFVAVNLFFAVGLLFGVAAPLFHFFVDGDESLTERRVTLARYRAVAAQENAVRDYARQVKESNTRGDLLEGTTIGVATAALQARLLAMAQAAGVAVLSIQALPLRTLSAAGLDATSRHPGDEPQLIGARIDVSGTPEAMHSFTRAIDTGPPLLFTTAAAMSQSTIAWRKPSEDEQPLIQAQIDVYGGALTKDRP